MENQVLPLLRDHRVFQVKYMLEPLFWPCTLRLLLPHLRPVRRLEKDLTLGRHSKETDDHSGTAFPRTDDVDLKMEITLPAHRNERVAEALRDAISTLETQEVHTLSFEQKLIMLRMLCMAAYDLPEVQSILARNNEERCERMAAQTKAEKTNKEKPKLKDVSEVLRNRVIENCRRANKLKVEALDEKRRISESKKNSKGINEAATSAKGKAKGKGKGEGKGKGKAGSGKGKGSEENSANGAEVDAFAPTSAQLTAELEEVLFLDSLGIEMVMEFSWSRKCSDSFLKRMVID